LKNATKQLQLIKFEPTILVSLDLSAAFDTIDHSQLISRLRTSFGISGTVLDWLSSYLLNRTQVVKMRNTISTSSHLASGVPQGSVLGPILFSAYISPIGKLAADYKLNHQQYADDTQLFISFSPSNPTPFVSQLETCLLQLHQWLCQNGLCLNPDKSDAIVFGTSKRLATLPKIASLCVAGTDVTLSNKIKTLGVTLDSCLSLNDHVSAVCGLCLYHIKALRHIRASLTTDVSITLATALVQSRLDYANSILYNYCCKPA
jgi:hypothetical protein